MVALRRAPRLATRSWVASAAGALCVAAPIAAFAQLAPLPSAAGSGLGGGQASALTFLPGVRVSQTVSDNLGHGPSGQERAGWQTDVSPHITASMRTSRAQASLNYSLHALYRSTDGDSDSSLRHDLRASGNALLVGDWFGVQGSASTYYVNTSPFGVLSADPITSDLNTSRVSTATLTPYVVGRLGTFADYRAQYSLSRSSTSENTSAIVSRGSDEVQLTLVSGPQFRKWGWSVLSRGSNREYRNGLDLSSVSTSLSAYYVVSPELRLGASATHSYIEGLANSKGETRGWGPGVSLDWAPNPRTTLRASAADLYYGSSSALALSHRAERWTFGLNYSRGVFTSNNAGILLYNPSTTLTGGVYDAALNTVFQQLVAQGLITNNDTVLASGVVNDALVRSHALSATLGYRLARGSVALTAYRNVRETLLDSTLFLTPGNPLITSSFGRFLSRGVSLSVGVPLSSRSNVAMGLSSSETESLTSADAARLTTLNATLSTRFDARTTGSIGYRRTVQSAVQGGVSSYDENALIGTVDMRF
ncbi:MAG: TIGR03016 family PEP-CTERM system-associated outer membrane protein [Burkholderiaceae bacterium]|nr:TIGR03016 family PEP-CTERM system-associated outer membrane protein [Burkholderiaceae bacterium]